MLWGHIFCPHEAVVSKQHKTIWYPHCGFMSCVPQINLMSHCATCTRKTALHAFILVYSAANRYQDIVGETLFITFPALNNIDCSVFIASINQSMHPPAHLSVQSIPHRQQGKLIDMSRLLWCWELLIAPLMGWVNYSEQESHIFPELGWINWKLSSMSL